MTRKEADDRAGGEDVVDAMEAALADMYRPIIRPEGEQPPPDEVMCASRPKARFILMGLREQGWKLVRE